ncbi:HpcH/HpaI aldolase/citrate lyase family protein [bacterium]|nr:HpcH/HpaI aldolase/citrate lyase family protein [bacterium]
MNRINYIELGATLFVPATHKDLSKIISKEKYPDLKSVLIDTEDGIDALNSESLPHAMERIENLLDTCTKSRLLVFIRPKNTDVLKKMLALKSIRKIDGFILPKFSLSNAQEYMQILKDTEFSIMPSIEGEELFSQRQLFELRDILLQHKEKIILVRFGLEDMLRQLGMRRGCEESVFDFSSTSNVLGSFIAIFKSSGFAVSGGVYPCFRDYEGFLRDVQRDLKEGLFSKTIIHPNQIVPTHESYRVTQTEFDEAVEIYTSKESVFNQNKKMAEKGTMFPHATEIIKRAEVYGIKPLDAFPVDHT